MYTPNPMSTKLKNYITIDPDILGGTPVISGTRIPVERLLHLVRQGYDTETLKTEFPQIDSKKIQYLSSYLMEAGLDDFEKAYKAHVTS